MTTWIIVATDAEIGNIINTAGADAKILVCGTQALATKFCKAPVAEVVHLALDEKPAEAFSTAVAEFLSDNNATCVLAANFPTERALTTAIAAKINATWISNAISWDLNTRQSVRNIAAMSLETVSVTGTVALTLPAGGEFSENGNPQFSEITLTPLTSVKIIAQEPATTDTADLSKSSRVIGVGRGIAEEKDLAMIRDLAEKIDAQIGGTRPLAEGSGWFDSYIGLTGQTVAADLYLAIGTSGQVHHAGGVRESNIIAAICDDPNAPIFQEADYGIVGDLYEIVPQIKAAL